MPPTAVHSLYVLQVDGARGQAGGGGGVRNKSSVCAGIFTWLLVALNVTALRAHTVHAHLHCAPCSVHTDGRSWFVLQVAVQGVLMYIFNWPGELTAPSMTDDDVRTAAHSAQPLVSTLDC
jgi:hypothetical protein